ncbi:MAG: tetratricopeptide repeat protein [Flammeovirgaceae bacterium]|nr:tetratricopeptide repeat protein [Flammeovirgaceae bacterium]
MHKNNNNYLKFKIFIIIIQVAFICGILTNPSFAQDIQEIQIANEYLLKGQKDKALSLYEQLAKKNENIHLIHSNYLNLLIDVGNFTQAESYVERLIKRDDKLSYRLDLGVVYVRSGDVTKADKYFKGFMKSLGEDSYKLKTMSDYLASRNLVEYSILALQQARTASGNSTMYTLELANLYRISGKRDQMVEEYLNYVTLTPSNISYIKNLMQILLTKPEELESLESLLYDRVQKNQNSEVYLDLLIWVNLQQKNFYGAFIQSRAYDKRFKKEQSKTLEIAQIALNNNDFDNADRSYSFVVKEYPNTINELPARLGLIQTREAKVKRSYPVNRDSVKYLITEYGNFRNSYPDHPNAFEAVLSQSLLYAYYLDQKDSAVNGLNRLIINNKVSPTMKAKAKIELGDIYLLKEEPWEATLLYSQVEKTQRETPLGYEAKLKNAKLSYFKGDFLLAQEHLDILKQATSREIANDAMELSMRIKENTTFDTTGAALKEYAAIELLLAQNKTDLAQARLNEFQNSDLITESIKDDVYWLDANLFLKRGEFDQAVALLEKIVTEFGDDILSDDAYFLEGEIFELHLKKNDKAMEIYREFLNKYPGSVYAAEARKRYRVLRGDFTEESTPKL